VTPVPGAPILLVRPPGARPWAIIADLHLGLGGTPKLGEGPPESSAAGMAHDLLEHARRLALERLVIAGDVKHPIVGTPPALRPVVFDFFSTLLSGGLAVEVVLGNHDVGLTRYLPKEVGVHPASGTVADGIGIFHGHRWPSNAVLRADRLVAGHLHPGYRLAPSAHDPRGKGRCWVRVTRAEVPTPPRRRRSHVPVRAREIIVLPAFNPIAGTEALNRRRPRPGRSFLVARFLALGEARAYLLDGTDLGPIPTVEAAGPRATPRRAPSAR
jgi:uncharacterized protein